MVARIQKIFVDDEIPAHGASHASSSQEASLEPIFKRREDLGKHSVYTHFPKDRNCEICERTKITRAPCRRRNGGAVLRAENFGDLITADHKLLSAGFVVGLLCRFSTVLNIFGSSGPHRHYFLAFFALLWASPGQPKTTKKRL